MRGSGVEDNDPLALVICIREISGEMFDVVMLMNDLASFPMNISI